MGSDSGLSLINTRTADLTEIYDSMFVPKQIIVVEEKSIAIVRAEKGTVLTSLRVTPILSAAPRNPDCSNYQ